MDNLKCQFCTAFHTLTLAMMLSHLIGVHSNDLHFSVKCDVPGCQRTFRKPRSYQSHLRRDHAEFNLHSPIQVYGVNGEQSRREEEEIAMEVTGHEPDIDESLYDELEVRLDEKKRNDALFLLQTKEANRFTQKATNSVMDNVTTLVRNTVEILRMGVQNRLDSAGLRFDAVPCLGELFEDDHCISNAFAHVNTEHKQAGYFKENFSLVVSINVVTLQNDYTAQVLPAVLELYILHESDVGTVTEWEAIFRDVHCYAGILAGKWGAFGFGLVTQREVRVNKTDQLD